MGFVRKQVLAKFAKFAKLGKVLIVMWLYGWWFCLVLGVKQGVVFDSQVFRANFATLQLQGYSENVLHLGITQASLVLRSVCYIFAKFGCFFLKTLSLNLKKQILHFATFASVRCKDGCFLRSSMLEPCQSLGCIKSYSASSIVSIKKQTSNKMGVC